MKNILEVRSMLCIILIQTILKKQMICFQCIKMHTYSIKIKLHVIDITKS